MQAIYPDKDIKLNISHKKGHKIEYFTQVALHLLCGLPCILNTCTGGRGGGRGGGFISVPECYSEVYTLGNQPQGVGNPCAPNTPNKFPRCTRVGTERWDIDRLSHPFTCNVHAEICKLCS